MVINTINRKWWVLVAMTGSLSMIFLDSTIVGVCLPVLQYNLCMTNTELQWVLNSYILAIASLVVIGGRLGDMVGRKKTFIIGMTIFALSSAFCGIAPTGLFLIISRGLQGVGAAIMLPASSAILTTSFDLGERGKAISIYAGISMVFMALGPLLGGFFCQYVNWRWCFYINLPIAIVSIALIFISGAKEQIIQGQKFDFQGAITFVAGTASLVFGIQEAVNCTWNSLLTVGLILCGIIIFIFFIKLEGKKEFPLIDFRLFKYENFSINVLILFFLAVTMVAQIFFNMIYIQNVLGFTPFYAGVISMFTIIPLAITVHFSGRLFDKVGVKKPVIMGLSLVLLSYIVASLVLQFQSIYLVLVYMMFFGVGVGFSIGPSQTDALNRTPGGLRGQASGITQTSRQMGATFGLALLSIIFNYFDNIQIQSIISFFGIDQKYYYVIMKILSVPPNFRSRDLCGVIAEEKIPILISSLKTSMSVSISFVYGLGVLSAALALIIATKRLKTGRQTIEVEYSKILH